VLVKTLFTEKLPYNRITNLNMTYEKMTQCPTLDLALCNKCQDLISPARVQVVDLGASSSVRALIFNLEELLHFVSLKLN